MRTIPKKDNSYHSSKLVHVSESDDCVPKNYGSPWTRNELVLAFELYCCIPFKKTKANNPDVINLANLLGRSPASVARKLGNFGKFDPELKKYGVVGLAHASKMDKQIWDEFNADWNGLVLEAEQLRESINPVAKKKEIPAPQGPSEREAIQKIRVHQKFFRDSILSSYNYTCCVTGLSVIDTLIASHIVPWSIAENLRTDPHNGLCLSATFDRLFDRGLMTITSDYKICISDALLSRADKKTEALICNYHGAELLRPYRFLPSQTHLEWHRSHLFQQQQTRRPH